MNRISKRLLLVTLAAVAVGPVLAGDLTVAWPEAEDELTVGYTVHVGTSPGIYDRVLDVGDVTRATLDDLTDGTLYYVAVKGYDAEGGTSPDFSPELASLPRPRIEALEPSTLAAGEAVWVSVHGANLSPELQVRSAHPRVSVRSAVATSGETAVLLVEVAPDAEAPDAPFLLEASHLTLINPGRKAPDFFASHPETVDLDGNGLVEEADADRVRVALGSRQGDEAYRVEADLDGDGQVDASDLELVGNRLGTAATWVAPRAEAGPIEGEVSRRGVSRQSAKTAD